MKSILFGALLLLASICRAEMHYFNFEFKGFETWNDADTTHYWQPDRAIGGFFAGDDRNGDEQISRDELTALTVNGRDFFTCASVPPPEGCAILNFAYRPGEVVKLSTHEWYHTFYQYSDTWIQTYDLATPFYIEGHQYEDRSIGVYWIPTLGTSYSLVPTVPEPSMAAMSLLGLALAAMFGRLRRSPNFERGLRRPDLASCA